MEVKASLNSVRVGCQKARIVANLIRGKSVNVALQELMFLDKKPAKLIKKLIESAVANAEQKQSIDVDNLYVKTITVDGGPSLKRWLPRAQGRATPILKKSSHINVILDER
jgi:large subunit ribosomal protein L22